METNSESEGEEGGDRPVARIRRSAAMVPPSSSRCGCVVPYLQLLLLLAPCLLQQWTGVDVTTMTMAQLIESERVEEYHKRNYTWPPKYVPDTPGWGKLMKRRLDQLSAIEDSNDRYNGYVSVMNSAVAAPNFTEFGWGLTRAPEDFVEELRTSLHEGMSSGNTKPEHYINVIGGNDRPLFVKQTELNQKALQVLKPQHEQWAGVPLVGAIAYGLRIYRNQSNLNMHADKAATHVISCILHVDHDEDSEPWPIVIEDFDGNTNEVILESGDMLFYESSKCLHGRPKKFNGEWYSSLFVHFYPEGWDKNKRDLEAHYAVPPHWNDRFDLKSGLEELQIVGTSMKESSCPHEWCALKDSVKWYGPAIPGTVISTGFQYPSSTDDEDGDDHGGATAATSAAGGADGGQQSEL